MSSHESPVSANLNRRRFLELVAEVTLGGAALSACAGNTQKANQAPTNVTVDPTMVALEQKQAELKKQLAAATRNNESKIAELAEAHPGMSEIRAGTFKYVTIPVSDGYYNFYVRADRFDQSGKVPQDATLWEVSGTAYKGQVPSGTEAYGIDLQSDSGLTYTSYVYRDGSGAHLRTDSAAPTQQVSYDMVAPAAFPVEAVDQYASKLSIMIDDASQLKPIDQTL